jgi:hypothetical protein
MVHGINIISDPCESHVCARPAEYCIVDSKTGLPRCQCPDCTHEPDNKICGELISKKTRTVTAPNECTLSHYACVSNQPYVVLHDGECRGEYTCKIYVVLYI